MVKCQGTRALLIGLVVQRLVAYLVEQAVINESAPKKNYPEQTTPANPVPSYKTGQLLSKSGWKHNKIILNLIQIQ